ncbi:possible DNA topoisomerase [alpha proteobacterium BAL199]|jgi:DNA topoisomerase III|nr:possible DNA topoisomerase [alpha proteobacterium BAL199]EDP63896.1 possible DNA topoisomerase [alpha proteobacterium BAL199]
MAEQIVITEKTSQAKDVRAAVGGRYGTILAAEGHLLDLQEPEDVVPEWKRWSSVLLRPEGLYGTRPAVGGNKAAKLKAIREALHTARRVWLATDCDREGQLIGQEILEHCGFRGEVLRVMFTAQDTQTIRDSFDRARPNADYAGLYAAAVARRQADQIYNLSLTRTATVTLGKGARSVVGVGRVKTPTLAIVCRRELEIRQFVPVAYFEITATATVAAGDFTMRHAPEKRILRRADAESILNAARDFEGPLAVRVEDKRQGPPKLHDLPSLQKLCASRFGWSAARTLEIAQELYDGQNKKIITYPRAEVRYLPESLIPDVPKIVAGLQVGKSCATIAVPTPPVIRKGAHGAFHDKGLEGASHHAVIPNVNTVAGLREVWPRLSLDEKKLFDVVARAYLAAMMPDFRYRQTTATLDVRGVPFKASGRQPIDLGWRAAFPEWQPADEKSGDAQLLPPILDGETARLRDAAIEDKETRPPPRYNEGTLIEAMQNAWRFVEDEALRNRLREAKGIGTPATRAEIIAGLKRQQFLVAQGKAIVPTDTGLALFDVLRQADPALVDPGVTAQLECLLDDVVVGKQAMIDAIDAVCGVAQRIIGNLTSGTPIVSAALLGGRSVGPRTDRPPTAAMKRFAESIARRKRIAPPAGYATSSATCRVFLEQHAPRQANVSPTDAHHPGPALAVLATNEAVNGGGTPAGATADPTEQPTQRGRHGIRKSVTPRRKAGGQRTAGLEANQAARPRRRRSTAATAEPASRASPLAAVGSTPLRIPYGNKEVARELGARYGDAGWYAPPGVDLTAFRDRGWL